MLSCLTETKWIDSFIGFQGKLDTFADYFASCCFDSLHDQTKASSGTTFDCSKLRQDCSPYYLYYQSQSQQQNYLTNNCSHLYSNCCLHCYSSSLAVGPNWLLRSQDHSSEFSCLTATSCAKPCLALLNGPLAKHCWLITDAVFKFTCSKHLNCLEDWELVLFLPCYFAAKNQDVSSRFSYDFIGDFGT